MCLPKRKGAASRSKSQNFRWVVRHCPQEA
jgi:hypothetical protein